MGGVGRKHQTWPGNGLENNSDFFLIFEIFSNFKLNLSILLAFFEFYRFLTGFTGFSKKLPVSDQRIVSDFLGFFHF